MTAADGPPIDPNDMKAVHTVFRESLGFAPGYVASADSDPARRALISNYYANVIAFLEAHHEGEEEILFPLLVERASEHRDIVTTSTDQHHEVVDLMHRVTADLQAWDADGADAAPTLVASLGALSSALVPHLDQEEEFVVPLASAHVTLEEWGQLPGHAMRTYTGDKIWLIMGLIRENFTDEQRDRMTENMPPPVLGMWESMGETSFNQLIAEVRQTA